MGSKESKSETFEWKSTVYDISAILSEIEQRLLIPRLTYIGKGLMDWYLTEMLRFDDESTPTSGRDRVTLSRSHVETVAQSGALKRPIIVADVGPDSSGMTEVRDDGSWHGTYVVIDGNHRLAYAHLNSVTRLPAYYLEREDISRFILSIDGYELVT
ncbi:ParB N-terminal domain-containing protein [Paraburkholderia sp. RP-4-7]|uniref:ParB N-terminal domain-containing protein n=1 Tax=Paraburkholderia polaris TaxID=2728848 RepID=A0A848IDE6_9BURK|nr:ParB N-terminal domain-containing protein [Paraburkholderia polaris]NML99640.1 ParB N-terminal domain-containing protein [Paraburkholderia polaris]